MTQSRNILRSLQLSALFMLCFGLLGCQGIPWKVYRTINPYSKTQLPDPYSQKLYASGGGEFQVLKFYATKSFACVVLRAHSKNAYAEIYVNPAGARLVAGKFGVQALTSSMAAREPMFKRMVRHYHRIKNPNDVSRWSRYYFPQGTIPPNKARDGFICFQLRDSPKDPKALKLGKKCRMQLTGLIVAKAKVSLDWFYFGPMEESKKK